MKKHEWEDSKYSSKTHNKLNKNTCDIFSIIKGNHDSFKNLYLERVNK